MSVRCILPALSLCLLACTPQLNWREVLPPGGAVSTMFPCKPSQERRTALLADQRVDMTVLACRAGESMFAIATADVEDPARVGPALLALRASAAANIAGEATPEPLKLKGYTPHPESGAFQVQGRLPDGRPVEERLAVFSVGTRVYQVTLFGPRLSPEAIEGFFGGLRVR